MGPLLFLIYINDICTHLKSIVQLYADDTSIFRVVRNRNALSAVNDMNSDLLAIQRWCKQWLVEVNTEKSVTMFISRKVNPTHVDPVTLDGVVLQKVENHKHLGLCFDSKLTWSYHIEQMCDKASKRLNMMLSLKYKVQRNILETIYKSYIRPILEYADIILDSCTVQHKTNMENIQIRAAQIVTGAKRHTSHALLYAETGWSPLVARRQTHKLIRLHQIVNNSAPQYLTQIVPRPTISRNTRQAHKHILGQFQCRLEVFKRSFFPSTIDSWNNTLSERDRQTSNKTTFARIIRKRFENAPLNDIQRLVYYTGERKTQIILSQMRVHFCDLNSHLFDKLCVESPMCSCEVDIESLMHFFNSCANYDAERIKFRTEIHAVFGNIPTPTLEHILHGDQNMNTDSNEKLCKIIHSYIKDTNRFK